MREEGIKWPYPYEPEGKGGGRKTAMQSVSSPCPKSHGRGEGKDVTGGPLLTVGMVRGRMEKL